MKPVYWISAIVLGVGLVAAWQLSPQADEATPLPAAAPAAAVPTRPSAPDAAPRATPPPDAPVDQVAQWISDSGSTDAAKRVAAITALAQAPREQALPVLKRLVMNADPAERPLALKSLQQLALAQGDADNGIRSAFREVIYHGDDEQLAAGAQDALDVVERSEQK